MSDQKYNVTLGASITKAEESRWADFGVVYTGMSYDQIVELEAIIAKHSEAMLAGMRDLISDLVAIGYQESEKRKAQTEEVKQPNGVIR